jgi:hypothetical protein
MFVYGAAFFLYRPGFVLTALGVALTLPLSFGPVEIGPFVFSLHWMLLGVTLVTLGLQCIYLGILTQVFFDYSGEVTKRWFARFPYTRTVLGAAAVFVVGLGLTGWLLVHYLGHGLRLAPDLAANYLGVTGLLLMIAGFMTFTFTLLLHSTAVVVWRNSTKGGP